MPVDASEIENLENTRPKSETIRHTDGYGLEPVEYKKHEECRKYTNDSTRPYRLAAEQGDALAQRNMGVLYNTGDGVEQDSTEAARWYQLAAEQGLAQAQCNLGFLYHKGLGVRQDDAEAARWYRLAAEQGHALAQLNLLLLTFTP